MDKPRTEAQIEASKANGKLSRGPVTPVGKTISSQNALSHGLLSSRALLPGEEQERFDRILTSALDKYQPEDEEELHMVHQLAMHQWRQLRVWAMQVAGHAAEILSQGEEPPAILERDMAWRAWEAFNHMHTDHRAMELLHRYEVSFENRFDRKRRELQRIKDGRAGLGGSL